VSAGTSYTLWDEATVKRLVVKQPDVMPYYPKARAIARGFDLDYGKMRITEQVTSSILQGHSIPRMASDLMNRIDTMTKVSAVRAARTSMTAAQNAGRQAAAEEAAKKYGLEIQKTWLATHDNRTRHEHAAADGQTVKMGEAFTVGGEPMMYPGDPSASPYLVYNCRCTCKYQTVGFKSMLTDEERKKANIRVKVTVK